MMLLFSALICSLDPVLPQPTNPPPESVPMRQDFVNVTLDLNTAHRRLLVSEDNRTATLVQEEQPYPDHPDRYQQDHQVLGSEGLTGRSYFEVQWNKWVDIAMTYKLNRTNGGYPAGEFGDNSYSWSLRIYDGHFYVCTKNFQTPIRRIFSAGQVGNSSASSGVVGVYLDYEAGILSFYEILDGGNASHLHTFMEAFTQPLFPGFGVWIVFAQRSVGNSVSLVLPPEKIHPSTRTVTAEEPVPHALF